jgi:hypothetical protein
MARVLRPGGQLQIIGASLKFYSVNLVQQLMKRPSPSNVLNGARTMINTLSYQWLGRRIWLPSSAFATAAPIYPTCSAMYRWMGSAGLVLRTDLIGSVGHETCFVADKPAHSAPPT